MAAQKHVFLMIALLLVVGTAWWKRNVFPSDSPARSIPELSPLSSPNPPAKVSPDSVIVTSSSATPSAQTTNSPHSSSTLPRPENNTVEFKLVDGLAIGFGDLILGELTSEAPPSGRGHLEVRSPQLWDHPEIPYQIAATLAQKDEVEKALAYLRLKTPVNFVPYSGQKDAILFSPGKELCLSPLGRTGGVQPIKLAPNCRSREILHEILHSLGFVHEQSRGDRDQFVEILWSNIEEGKKSQFAQVPEALLEPLRDSPFDFHSLMLYPPSLFVARPELQNMRSLTSEPIDPVREGLSDGDIARIKHLFSAR